MPEAVSAAEELFARVPAQLSVCAEYDGDTEYRRSEQLHMQTRSVEKKAKKATVYCVFANEKWGFIACFSL